MKKKLVVNAVFIWGKLFYTLIVGKNMGLFSQVDISLFLKVWCKKWTYILSSHSAQDGKIPLFFYHKICLLCQKSELGLSKKNASFFHIRIYFFKGSFHISRQLFTMSPWRDGSNLDGCLLYNIIIVKHTSQDKNHQLSKKFYEILWV